MARVNVYIKDSIFNEIQEIVEQKHLEGASRAECNMSNTCSQFLEDGLLVYKFRKSGNVEESGFSQELFNKMLLENAIKSRVVSQKIMAMMLSLMEIKNDTNFSKAELVNEILKITDDEFSKVFPKIDEDE